MARTAIAITQVGAHCAGANLTATVGDATNDHSIAQGFEPRLILIASNYHSSAISVNINIPQGIYKSASTQRAITVAIPAAVGSVAGKSAWIIDHAYPFLSNGFVPLDSADANFNLCRLYAYTWTPTYWGRR